MSGEGTGPRGTKQTSESIRETYTAEYYLTDCGGFRDYELFGGKRLGDQRLSGVAAIGSLRPSGRVLDLGCGRGELAFHFAQSGHLVTAVDYSQDAIRLAEKTFSGHPELRNRVELICESVTSLKLEGDYELVVASDIVEHLSPNELDRLYQSVSAHLTSTGIFVVHTYPNRWFFDYDYVRRKKEAARLGEQLPKDPRSPYELLMHINEQNPRVLRRQLARYFPHVLLWFCEPADMGGSFVRRFTVREMMAARDLCAIASFSPIDEQELRSRFHSPPYAPQLLRDLRLELVENRREAKAGEEFTLEVEVDNRTTVTLGSSPPNPVLISYHWMFSNGKEVVRDGLRSIIQPPLPSGCRRKFAVQIVAPQNSGHYRLRITMVQEGVQWFDAPPINVFHEIPMVIS